MPIQGAAADIIKLAMVRVHRQLKEAALEARLIMQSTTSSSWSVPRPRRTG